MIFKVADQIQVGNKYLQCVCADKMTAVFAPLTKKKDCLRTSFKDMVAYSNTEAESSYKKVLIKQWDGSLKPFAPIKNAIKTSEIDENRTLTVFTKQGKLVFKKGQYIKQVKGEISKP